MGYEDVVLKIKENIRREAGEYDSRLRLKGNNTFKKLLKDIDKNPDLRDEDICRKVFSMLEYAIIFNRNKGNTSFLKQLKNRESTGSFITLMRRYKALYKNSYLITRDDIETYLEMVDLFEIDECKELNDMFYKNQDSNVYAFNLYCDDNIYYCEIPNLQYDGNNKEDSKTIRLYAFEERGEKLCEPVYSARVELDIEGGELVVLDKQIKMVCGNTECKFYKESFKEAYKDGSKSVECDWMSTNKCDKFNKRLSPEGLFEAVMAMVFAFNTFVNHNLLSEKYSEKSDETNVTECSADDNLVIDMSKYYDILRESLNEFKTEIEEESDKKKEEFEKNRQLELERDKQIIEGKLEGTEIIDEGNEIIDEGNEIEIEIIVDDIEYTSGKLGYKKVKKKNKE